MFVGDDFRASIGEGTPAGNTAGQWTRLTATDPSNLPGDVSRTGRTTGTRPPAGVGEIAPHYGGVSNGVEQLAR
jgi:hypothetical protein